MRAHTMMKRLAPMLLASAIWFGISVPEAGAQVLAGSPYMSS